MSHLYAGRLFAAYPGGEIERAVLVAMSLYMCHRDPSQAVTASVETLAGIAGFRTTRVREAQRRLEEEGWIIAIGSRKGGRAMAIRYRINVDMLASHPDRTKLNPTRGVAFVDAKPNAKRTETQRQTQINPTRGVAEQGLELQQGFEQGAGAPAGECPTPPKPGKGSQPQKPQPVAVPRAGDRAAIDRAAAALKVQPYPGESYGDYDLRVIREAARTHRDRGLH